jgi:hypothetical protein
MTPACGSIFDMRAGVKDEIRFCNRGHGQLWTGRKWEIVRPAEGVSTPEADAANPVA